MTDDEMWAAVLGRDSDQRNAFVYAVRSTGIYCRPSCPSRKPRREQVAFYRVPADAEAAGFRPCLRCHPAGDAPADPNVALMQRVCRYLESSDEGIPSLADLSARFGMSPYHLQRTFRRLVGVSPRQYAKERRLSRFKMALKRDADVTGALYSAGYGSGSSAYEESSDGLGMTPARYRRGGEDQAISYTVVPCSLGWLLVAATGRGLCAVRLGESAENLVTGLEAEFPAARLDRDHAILAGAVAQLSAYLEGRQPHLDLPIDVRATAFQRQVWSALRAIPYGATQTYQQVARAIERPSATRAVAGACARNPVALVVPCHRVVRSDGELGGYRWGIDRKKALLQQEALHVDDAVSVKGGPG